MAPERLAIDGGTPVRATMLDHRRGAAQLGDEERDAVLEVLASKSLFRYYGPALLEKVREFERDVEQLFDVPHALATSSGTAGLLAGLAALGVGPGDEVVVPAVTFIATPNAVVVSGAVPIFCEVDDTLGLDAVHLESLINERTAAIVPVHLENVVSDMDPIRRVAEDRRMPVLEDACQAMGATYRGAAAGTLGDIGVFSLQLEKNITTGEGGVLVTADPTLYNRAIRYTDQGGQFVTGRGESRGHEVDEPFVGENLRMAELAGALAGVQLRRLPTIIAAMRSAKAKVLDGIGSVPGLTPRRIPDPDGEGASSIVWFAPDAGTARSFVRALLAEGVPAAQVYGAPVYANPAYLNRRTVTPKRSPWRDHPVDVRYELGMCPRSEDLAARSVGVAIGPGYTASDAEDVVTAVTKVAAALL